VTFFFSSTMVFSSLLKSNLPERRGWPCITTLLMHVECRTWSWNQAQWKQYLVTTYLYYKGPNEIRKYLLPENCLATLDLFRWMCFNFTFNAWYRSYRRTQRQRGRYLSDKTHFPIADLPLAP
jgi:hypothetical protein